MLSNKNTNHYFLHAGWYTILTAQTNESNIKIAESYKNIKANDEGEYDIRLLRMLHSELIENDQNFQMSIQAAKHFTPFTFGCYSIALSTCRSLYDFLKITCDNFIYIAPQINLSLNQNNDEIEIIFIQNPFPKDSRVTKSGYIIVICTLLEMMRNLNNKKAIPFQLYAPDLNYNESEKNYLKQRYNCTKLINKKVIKLTFKEKDLIPTVENYHPEIHYHNLTFVHQRVENLKKSDICLQICNIFEQCKSLKDINANYVAQQLHISPRTLIRRLASVNTSFTSTLDCYRLNKAIRLLKKPEISMTEITYQLGFSELSSFSRAFKRWTGNPPTKLHNSSMKE
ncbi:AraC family transcriptional regulator [uncultured Photobacterium sp.]|uniref:helix-turn-helix domain-containing protein n=1 Tax=uncultured Photobacterium sp. TaxID=173973 RepID=UPI00262FE6A9|nr:AraC family transcriptional regulator [uncultured Photobacterium sp.]